jgi:hypothetical protein
MPKPDSALEATKAIMKRMLGMAPAPRKAKGNAKPKAKRKATGKRTRSAR